MIALLAESEAYCKQLNALGQIIAANMRDAGPLPFDRFMELALFHPDFGYYERPASPQLSHNLNPNPSLNPAHSSLTTPNSALPIGRLGDFYTSVSVGSLFGELLAFQFAGWLDEIKETGPLHLVEAGAHDGKLAGDILGWLREWRPELVEKLKYWIIEPSARRRQWQADTLGGFEGTVRWFADWRDLPEGVNGVIFSNELLDSFPIQRFGWDAPARKWFEWAVSIDDGRFVWVRVPLAGGASKSPNCRFINPELESVLPDGYIIESCPRAEVWWGNAADALRRGRLLTFDYGLARDEIVIPERTGGTLRGYRAHHPVVDVLADPGEQDLTAHVNFAVLQSVGEAEGLATEGLDTQSRFVSRIAQHAMLADSQFGEWTPSRVRQFQTLSHPEHLGRAFRVLIQKR